MESLGFKRWREEFVRSRGQRGAGKDVFDPLAAPFALPQ